MATRIKASASASASAVRRRIKRRSERASHKKKTNATLRSRKQRARKTARVMRGGGGTPYHYCMYNIDNIDNTNSDAFKTAFIKGEPGEFKCSDAPILKLKFSKNMLSDSHTLTLEFDLDNLGGLSIQDIINGLLTTLFKYDLSGNQNIPLSMVRGTHYTSYFDVNHVLHSHTAFATKAYAEEIEGKNEAFNRVCPSSSNKKSIKKNGVFSQPCVIEIQFEPAVSRFGENVTIVRFMSYTTLGKAGVGCGYIYYGWSKYASYPKGVGVLQVDEEFKPENGFLLNKKKEFYVFPSYKIYGDRTPRYIFRFDKNNITKQIDSIRTELINLRTELINPPPPPPTIRTAFDDEFEKADQLREKRLLEEQRMEEERRLGLTQEQRDAEDRAAAEERKRVQWQIDYDSCGPGGCDT